MNKNKGKFVGKPFDIASHKVQLTSSGCLVLADCEGVADCTLIATGAEVKAIVATARAFEVAEKMESKLKLSGELQLEPGDCEYGLQVGCTFVPYSEILSALKGRGK